MKFIVSGGAGFVGSTTIRLLSKHGHEVLVVDNFSTGRSENLKRFRGKVLIADITDYASVDAAFYEFGPDAVLHLAAQSAITTSHNDPQLDLQINGVGTLNMLRAAQAYEAKRFVFSSTSAVYLEKSPKFGGVSETWACQPTSPYGISKLACEHYIRTMMPNHMILRYGNVYGPRQRPIGQNQVIARALSHFHHGDDFFVVGSGNQKRDFVFVGDVAYANMMALTSDVVGTFNVATGKNHSVNEVLAILERIYEVPGYAWEHTNAPDPRGDVSVSANKIRKELGWKAVMSLEDGLKETSKWWRNEEGK